jgi:metal-responsive CopG/Arc/MetJ family transcriptional regulator
LEFTVNLDLEPTRKEQMSIKVEPRMLQALDLHADRLKTTRAGLVRAILRNAIKSLDSRG